MKKIIRWLASQFGMVAVDWQTAEYLACLSGQIPWGNQKRRGHACADLGDAMTCRPMTGSLECFQEATWDIITKKR